MIVTPLVGVWIEIVYPSNLTRYRQNVTPLVGVWIEIALEDVLYRDYFVAPLVGTWIEMDKDYGSIVKRWDIPIN